MSSGGLRHTHPPPRILGSIPPKKKRGAPEGNRNALKHGLYTAEMEALRKGARLRRLKIKATLALLAARTAQIKPPARSWRAAPEGSAPLSGAAPASASRGK